MMIQCCSGNDAVIGLADRYALFTQFAINISGSNEYRF